MLQSRRLGERMGTVSGTSLTAAEVREATWAWWLAVVVGLMAIVAGVIVIAKPSDSLKTLAVISGIFVLLDGVLDLIAALIGGAENRGLAAVLGVVSAIVGVLLIRHPISGVTFIALLLAVWLIAAGVVKLVVAFDAEEHRARRIVVALVLTIAGIVIAANPNIGYATLALLTGIGFICYGVAMLIVGWAMRLARREATSAAHAGPAAA